MFRNVCMTIAVLATLLSPVRLFGADNVIFVTWDGFRWQELFGGAEAQLINTGSGGVTEPEELKAKFWRDSPEARREVLLPFFWKTLAKNGQVFGDASRKSASEVTNGKKFSYPGYNEMFVGFADDRIKSNDKIPNPNINVLEYLHRQPGFAGKVAAFATWDVMDFILNRERSGLLVHTGWLPVTNEPLTPTEQETNRLVRELPRLWRGNAYDVISFRFAMEHLKKHRPRVLYLGLGETDEWAHARRYDLYLEAANRSDRYLQELWEMLQTLPEYKGRTSLLVTTDHGRGESARDWTNHNAETPGAEFIWIGVMGPGIPAKGIRENTVSTQSQVAATLAGLVDVDFIKGSVQSAPALPLESPAQ
jgi:hypothetical protein